MDQLPPAVTAASSSEANNAGEAGRELSSVGGLCMVAAEPAYEPTGQLTWLFTVLDGCSDDSWRFLEVM